MKASESFVRELARAALMSAASGVREGTCDVVSAEFAVLMEEVGTDAYGAVWAPFKGRQHYVSVVPGSEVAFTDDTYVIVDATVKQFGDEVETDLPGIAVVPSSDPRWDVWYSEVRLPDCLE